MTISFINHTNIGKRFNAMKMSCDKFGISYRSHVITNKDINEPQEFIKSLGDVVLRGASGDIKIYNARKQTGVRSSFSEIIRRSGKILINHGLYINPDYKNKYTQQHHIQTTTSLDGIPTFIFHNLEGLYQEITAGNLSYPLIIKPTVGAKGEGIFFCHSQEEIENSLSEKDLCKYIIQPFIKNSSDRRVLIVGGTVLGIMKRSRKDHAFANNISQGGTAEKESDPQVYDILRTIGEKAAASFQCNFVGVDIIYDEIDHVYRFMEINTLPMREGFESVHPDIIVTDELIQLCQRLYQVKQDITSIEKSYLHHITRLPYAKALHFLDRTENLHNNKIQNLIQLPTTPIENFSQSIQSILFKYKAPKTIDEIKNHHHIRHNLVVNEYPKLKLYNSIFRECRAIQINHQQDISEILRSYIDKKDLLHYHKSLCDHKEHIAILSTSAMNFLTYMRIFLHTSVPQGDQILSMVQALSGYNDHMLHKMRIYTLTHYIIGETNFYTQQITDTQQYTDIIIYLENYITDHYGEISLDCKYEFLLCCKLLNYNSYLKPIVFHESKKSLSVIDAYIAEKDFRIVDTMATAEHRNTLFLMVFKE